MKRSHIIALVGIAVAIGTILTVTVDASTYTTFNEAMENPGKKFTIIGELNRDKEIISEANYLHFYMIDKDGNEVKVVLDESKPQDFEKSEEITIRGVAEDDGVFYAHSMQMKCPSKYNEQTHEMK